MAVAHMLWHIAARIQWAGDRQATRARHRRDHQYGGAAWTGKPRTP